MEIRNTEEAPNKLLFDLQLDNLDFLISKTKCTRDKKCSVEFSAENVILKEIVADLDYKD